jgi:cytochrome c oxidase assembly factor CtaG
MAVAAPLIVCARPGGAYAWAVTAALGARASGRLIAGLRLSGARAVWTALTRPSAATLLHGAAIWVWHAPPLFERTVTSVPLHRFQHVSFLVTGVLVWWALARRRNHGVAALHLFATMLHTSILGALIALAPHVLYRLQTGGAAEWGLTPLEDQQLAGLVMWIPAGAIYAGAALCCFAGWVRRCGAAAPASVLPPSGILVGDAAE